MKSFNEIYLLDLHGNSLKKEKCPDGSKDENVFDIQQGVAIALFIKKHPPQSPLNKGGIKGGCKVSHSEVWGVREDKYAWLNKHDVKTTKWKTINPKSEFYLFIPRDEGLLKQYEKYPKITDIFPVNSVGIVTSRDDFVIDRDRATLKRRIMQFRDKRMPDEIIGLTYNLKDKSDWKLKDVREEIMKDDDWEQAITRILYRPFDEQWIFYHDAVIERPRKEVMQHMMRENLGLLTCRQQNTTGFYHALVSDTIVESCIVSNQTREISYLFPLYLYQQKDKPKKKSLSSIMILFEPQAEYVVKKPNISQTLLDNLKKEFRREPSPEQIFYYIYAVLYSNIYRTKYAEFLKIDFPRVPFTKDYKLFKKMGDYGERLVELHLLKSSEIDTPIVRFQGEGNDKVEKVWLSLRGKAEAISKDEILRCAQNDKLDVHINPTQYFEGIPLEVWKYQIGGYQVCEKWLKDRKGRTLSVEETRHYCKIVTALKKTIEIQTKIDSTYLDIENEIIDFSVT